MLDSVFLNTAKAFCYLDGAWNGDSPFSQCLDEYDDDEAGQKERKREDAITQQNTIQNEAASLLDPGASYLSQVSVENGQQVPGYWKNGLLNCSSSSFQSPFLWV